MTDGEPEPFRMTTGPDAADTPADAADDVDDAPADDVDAPLPGGAESIADLIDEASRTAAEQAVQEATGTAPVDRSGDVWGSADIDDDDEDLDALWSAAADRHRGSRVFDAVLGPDDDWGSAPRMPPAAADPTIGVGGGSGAEPEPEVFKLSVDDSADEGPDPVAADVPPRVDGPDDEDDPEVFRFAAGPATTAPAAVPDHVPEAGRDEPDVFAFAFDDIPADAGEEPPDDEARTGPGDGDPQEPIMRNDDPADDDAAEPTTQEEPVSQESEAGDDERDPWAVPSGSQDDAGELWATSTERVEPVWDAAPDDDAPWSSTDDDDDDDAAFDDEAPWSSTDDGGGDDAAPDDEEEHDDSAWTFDVRDDVVAWDEDLADPTDDDQDTVGTDGEERTLAESARPRADTGWQDLSDAPSRWTLDPTPTGEDDGFTDAAVEASAPDPDTFSALLGEDATDAVDAEVAEGANEGFLPDDEPLAPTREPDPPFQTGNAGLGDVIDDLIGDLGPAPTTPGGAGDDRDDLTDALAGLDQFDDVGSAAADAADVAPTDEPAASAPAAPTPPDLAAMPPPSQPTPAADDLLAATPPPALPAEAPAAAAASQDAPDDTSDQPDAEADEPAPSEPEPTPAPQGMTFASKPKKRGLFGR